jgi:LysM repeat protein
MNNPSPLVPQGSLMEYKNKSRSRVKTAVFCVVGVHVVALLAALFAQGCKREQAEPPPPESNLPAMTETNLPPVLESNPPPLVAETNIPVPPPAEPPPTAPAPKEYVIQKGDSFYTIGKKLNIPWTAIRDANPNVDPNKLQVNQKIVIPTITTQPTAGGVAPGGGMPAPVAGGDNVYIVKSGDTLWRIARAHGTTVSALRSANNLITDRLKVDQKLIIPVKAAAPAPAPAETTPAPPTGAPAGQ